MVRGLSLTADIATWESLAPPTCLATPTCREGVELADPAAEEVELVPGAFNQSVDKGPLPLFDDTNTVGSSSSL